MGTGAHAAKCPPSSPGGSDHERYSTQEEAGSGLGDIWFMSDWNWANWCRYVKQTSGGRQHRDQRDKGDKHAVTRVACRQDNGTQAHLLLCHLTPGSAKGKQEEGY